jgi:hypothetical protein
MEMEREVSQLKNIAVSAWKRRSEIGPVRTAFDQASLRLDLMRLYYILGGSDFPELSNLYDRLFSPAGLLNAKRAADGVMEGVKADQLLERVSGQVERLKREARRVSQMEFREPAKTPVDRELEMLALFREKLSNSVH